MNQLTIFFEDVEIRESCKHLTVSIKETNLNDSI